MEEMDSDSVSMRSNVVWNTLGCVFYQGCQWIITVLVVALSSDYSNSGVLAFAMSIGNVFFGLATYNMRTYQISDTENENSAGNYIAMRIVTIAIALALCLCYAALASGNERTVLVVLVYLLFKSDEAFSNVLYGIDQKAQRMDFVGQSQIIRGLCSVLFFGAFLYVFNSLILAVGAMAASCMVVTFLFDMMRSGRLADSLRPNIEKRRLLHLLRICLPSVCSIVVSGLVVASARQIFFFNYGDAALGIYASVTTPSVLVQVLANNLYSPMLLPIAEAFNESNRSLVIVRMVRLILIVASAGLVVSFGLSIVGKPLLALAYGSEIAEYSYLLFPALVMTTLMAVSYLLSDLLIIVRCMWGAFTLNAVALAVVLVSIHGLIERYYMNGINISLVLAYSLSLIVGIVILTVELRGQVAKDDNGGDHCA